MTPPTKLSLKIPMPRPEFFHSKRARPSRLLPTPEEVEHVQPLEEERCRPWTHEVTTQEAKEWIESMIRSSGRWDNHLSIIRIDCPYTMAELLELGRLPQPEGVRQCRRMVRAPVIYDEIGCFLWERLAEMERGPNFRVEDEEREAEYAREMRMRMTLANLDERFLPENQDHASGERAAELARESAPKTALPVLDERFHFNTPKYAPGERDRARQDSDPVSPTEVKQPQPQPQEKRRQQRSPGRRPHSPKACHFCGHDSICENTEALEEIRSEALQATRGRVVSHRPRKVQEKTQNPTTANTATATAAAAATTLPQGAQTRPAGLRNHSRRSSYASTLLWHRDYSSSICSSRATLPRNNSVTEKMVHVVGNLGKNVGSTLGHSLSHGYGYAGRQDRAGSV